MFSKGSRYYALPNAVLTDPSGRQINYKAIRYISEVGARRGHIVGGADRLDLIAFRYYQDPEDFWRICDANLALWPDNMLANPGAVIRIPEAG